MDQVYHAADAGNFREAQRMMDECFAIILPVPGRITWSRSY